jgi:DNA-binding IclR family transcriptional regulator
MTAQRTKGVDSARRALQILLQFSQNKPELTVDDLLEAHDISLPSAYRYLSLLREMNFIEERSKGVFVLSPQILTLAQAAENMLDYKAEAQPILDRLRRVTGETSLYLRRVNDSAVCLAIAESEHAINISFTPGHLMPLHAGAGAKTLLSDYSEAKRDQYLDRREPPLSTRARTALLADLDHIRTTGFAESLSEVDEGVWACAAPVRASSVLVGTISVVAPAFRVDAARREKIGADVRTAARELEDVLATPVGPRRAPGLVDQF